MLKKIKTAFASMFQFPSNGKVYLNLDVRTRVGGRVCVSIPFKRESISERGKSKVNLASTCQVSIPFKRESISEPSSRTGDPPSGQVSIPFKRESISEHRMHTVVRYLPLYSFNSLQTGKYIWTLRGGAEPGRSSGFNSLQTGKYIWTPADNCYQCVRA